VAASGGGMPIFEIPCMPARRMAPSHIAKSFGKLAAPRPHKTRRVTVRSHSSLIAEESDKLLDQEQLVAGGNPFGRAERQSFPHEIDRSPCRDVPVSAATCRSRSCRARPAAADRSTTRVDATLRGEERTTSCS